jgi:hypothetical protein
MRSFVAALVAALVVSEQLHSCSQLSLKWSRRHFVEHRIGLVLLQKYWSLGRLAAVVAAAAAVAASVVQPMLSAVRLLLAESTTLL